MEALTTKGVLVIEVGREEAQSEFMTIDEMGLRRESLIASQVAADCSDLNY